MSYSFESNGETLWDPALRIGKMYVSYAKGMEDVLGVPSGLSPTDQDWADVDPVSFAGFVSELCEWYFSSPNWLLHGLMRTMLMTSLVMLERAGGELPAVVHTDGDFVAELKQTARHMNV
ncbi:DUF6086 family protein [Micromonospora costi]|uniref:DUF6086 family protein n=1 Tax=Micromonospora costi TaxID=1530042 RepID=UPI00340E9E2F